MSGLFAHYIDNLVTVTLSPCPDNVTVTKIVCIHTKYLLICLMFQAFALFILTITALALLATVIIQTQLNQDENSVHLLDELDTNDRHFMKRSPIINKFTIIYEGSWLKKLAFPIRQHSHMTSN